MLIVRASSVYLPGGTSAEQDISLTGATGSM